MVVVVDVQKDKKHKKHKDSVEDEGVDSAAPATPAAASAAPSAMSPDDAAVKIQSQARRLEAKKKVEKVKQDKSKKAEASEDLPCQISAKPSTSDPAAGVTLSAVATPLPSTAEPMPAVVQPPRPPRRSTAALTPDEAATKIQSQARRVAAKKRVDGIRLEPMKAYQVSGPAVVDAEAPV